MKYLLLALALTGCGLLDDLEEVVDPPPEEPIQKVYVVPVDTLPADTLGEPRPPSPPGGVSKVTFSIGGAD